jgi:predicted  nucleic acid-binding Zn-ribbon protein
MVKNPKELQDLQKEIVSLHKHLVSLEDELLQAMIEFEEAEQAELTSQTLQKKAEAEVIQAKAGLAGERSQLAAKLDNLGQERSAALTPIPADHLEIYQHIREQKHGIAVTSVEDEACSSCGAQIRASEAQSARIQSKLQYCSSCGRILFAG